MTGTVITVGVATDVTTVTRAIDNECNPAYRRASRESSAGQKCNAAEGNCSNRNRNNACSNEV
jgi:hypothetical protein